ncbi:DUF5689 domain-containing protein [Pedobacter alpinus]|uniref:DUF5689 domain-containing protein n=1 Tax=Pedobacter alpinus TaxID=1590643 RepID=A0ABW5TTI7_9SPHI
MKKFILYALFLFSAAVTFTGCDESNYPGGTISPYIPIYDLRNIYKGTDVNLSIDNMFGSNQVTGVVVSDHSGNNLPSGLLVIQDRRRLNQLRGISITIGAEAANYIPGDSVNVKIDGGILKRVDGLLQVTNIPASAVTKVGSGKNIPPNRVPSSYILADPNRYESTLVAIVKGGFDPLPQPTDVLSGEKTLNDGFENITLKTDANATFANKNNLPVLGNFFGIVFNTLVNNEIVPQVRLRTESDIIYLSSTIEISPIIISGFMADPVGGDGNYEYMQFLATRDINFAVTPFSVVVTNNAGASLPTGFPSRGWATGSLATSGAARTYQYNLTSGFVAKGTFFYVGGSTKLINGAGSPNISAANWITAINYTTIDGANGNGRRTTNVIGNSGNASGIAVFEGTNVNVNTKPVDVIFIGSGGSLFTAGPPPVGYRIANTDFYDIVNPITLESQPFYRNGSNTLNFNYLPSNLGYFNKLGGIYNADLGRWVKARTQTGVLLTSTSTLTELEENFPVGPTPDDPGTPATSLKQ